MEWEIEIKSKLAPPLLAPLKGRIKELYPQALYSVLTYRDVYWGAKRESVAFRLRYTPHSLTVTHKRKSWGVEGVEMNRESEFSLPLEEASKVEAFFAHLGYKPLYEKEKRGEAWQIDKLTIEIVEVPPLGHFIEIEYLSSDKELALERLQEVRQKLMIEELPLEERYYSEMLPKE